MSQETIPIFGIDFTCAPRQRKPITLARGQLTGNRLKINAVDGFTSLDAFGDFIRGLDSGQPSVTGIDFPFGQPRRLVENLGWNPDWSEVVRRFGAMSRPEFVEFLRKYRAKRAPGDKQHLRTVDAKARGCSPMMLYGVPVGRMYQAAAPILEASRLNLPSCRPTSSSAIVVEAYPSLIARPLADGAPYKTESSRRKNDPVLEHSRRLILGGILNSPAFAQIYGIRLTLPSDGLGAVADASGDRLDAISCAIAAAWSWTKRAENWGIPIGVDKLEGWISDPTLLSH